MCRHLRPICFGIILTLGLLTVNVKSANVMSVDLGNEWMKVGVVSPGVPMEIALNKESKRKTPAVIAFRDGVRLFGEDAQTMGVRFPSNSYAYFLDLLGKKVDHPIVQQYQKRFPYYNIEADSERGTVVFRHDDETTYSVEELIAQLLVKAREMAEQFTGQIVNECVLTVPGYFNQAERRAFLQAASLAKLKVLQLMNDYTAVALNYGIFRRKEINETAHYIMFYDVGAHKTTASIVEYKTVKTKDRGYVETHPQVQIVGVGYDRTLGGLEISLRLRDFLVKEFNAMKKTPNDIATNGRAMAKLFKEANRLKTVLSANNDHFAQVEGLIDEKDYKLKVTRDTLERLSNDLFERAPGPIEKALKNAGLTMDVITQVILVGAGTRVPKIQETLLKTIKTELGKNINADEAATLGAAYRAADLSQGFKVKPFIIRDAVLFPVQVTFAKTSTPTSDTQDDASVDVSTPRLIKRTLFGPMNPYPQKKVITFNRHNQDFTFSVSHGDLDFLGQDEITNLGPLNISTIDLIGVSDVIKKNTGENIESKGIKAHFNIDDSGILNLLNIEYIVEKTVQPDSEESPLSKLGSTISKLFSGDEKQDDATEKPVEEEKSAESEKTDDATKNDTATNKTVVDKPVKPKIVTVKEPINSKVHLLIVPQLNEKQYETSVSKINDLNTIEAEQTRRATALNLLESFVIEAQSRLDLKEYSDCATEDEKSKIIARCSEVSEWLYEDGADADAVTYELKLEELRHLTKDIYERHYEHSERPEALNALKSILNGSEVFLEKAKNLTKDVDSEKDVFTATEINTLENAISETKTWRDEIVAEQKALKKNEPLKLTVKSIAEKMALLDREVKYLINKLKIWKPKKKETPKTEEAVISGSGDESNAEKPEPLTETPEAEEQPSETKQDSESNTEATPDSENVPEDGSETHSEL